MPDAWVWVLMVFIGGLIVKTAISWIVLRGIISTYIVARTEKEALVAMEKLLKAGYSVTSDQLGEFVRERTALPEVVGEICQHIRRLGELKKKFPDKEVSIAIKPSRIGSEISEAHFVFNARRICTEGLLSGVFVWFDAEKLQSRNLVFGGLEKLIKKRRRNFGAALQSMHSDSLEVLDFFTIHDIPVRLVKGAYGDGSIKNYNAIGRNLASLYELAKQSYRSSGKIALGTCDSVLLDQINDPDVQYQFLYGVRSDLQEEYLSRGRNVLIYFVWGPLSKAQGYMFRRLREGARIGSFFNFIRNIFEARRFRKKYGI